MKIFCVDLDKTLLSIDITEGTCDFVGIVEHLYNLNIIDSVKYPTFNSYANDYYNRIDLNDTSAYVMPYLIYNENQNKYIYKYWETTIQYFFNENIYSLIQQKIKKGYKIWIVSASPYVYIEPILKYIDIDKIVAVEPNQIISFGIGKVNRLIELTDKKLCNIHGFVGNSWNNDGDLMTYLKNLNYKNKVYFKKNKRHLNKNICKNIHRYNIKIIK